MKSMDSPGRNLLLGSVFALFCVLSSLAAGQDNDDVHDPWEGFNRRVFQFNDGLDTYLLKPVAKGYKAVAPEPVERGVTNFFNNLSEVGNVVNDVLQGKFNQAANDSGRFLINSTVGVAGLFDVAKGMGLERNDGEDFGQTLSAWGSGQGPFVMLPFFGPSTLRDVVGMPVNSYTNPVTHVDHVPTRNTLLGTDIIETRAGLLDVETLLTGDRYIIMRDAYLQRRDYLINDGEIEDSFGADGEFGDDDEF